MLCAGIFGSDLTLDQGVELAKKEGKPLLIDFYAVWCGPCNQFKKAAHADADIVKLLEQVVLVKLDAEKDNGKVMAERFQVNGYPTYILANSELKTIYRWSGYEKAYFTEKLNGAMKDLRPMEDKMLAFEANPKDGELAANIGDFYYTQGEFEHALEFFTKADSLSQEKSYQFHIFGVHFGQWSQEKKPLSYQEMSGYADHVFASKKTLAEEQLQTADLMIRFCKATQQNEQIADYVKKGLEVSKLVENLDAYAYITRNLDLDNEVYVNKDMAAAVILKKAQMPEGWQENPDALNNFAWWCFENKTNLDEAVVLAEKGIEKAEAGRAKANIYDTLAEVYFSKGQATQAISAIESAIKEDPSNDYFKKQLERFKKGAGKSTI